MLHTRFDTAVHADDSYVTPAVHVLHALHAVSAVALQAVEAYCPAPHVLHVWHAASAYGVHACRRNSLILQVRQLPHCAFSVSEQLRV